EPPRGGRRRGPRPPRPVAHGSPAVADDVSALHARADLQERRPAPGPQVAAAHCPHPRTARAVSRRPLPPPPPRPLPRLPVHGPPVAVAVLVARPATAALRRAV